MTRSIEDIRKKAAENIAEFEREESIKKSLPMPSYPWKLCVQKDEVWVKIEPERQTRFDKDAPEPFTPTLQDVLTLAEKLPPIPLRLYKDGCTSIAPKPPKGKTEDDGHPVASFIIDAEGSASYCEHTATIRWWANLNRELVRVSVVFRPPCTGELGMVKNDCAGDRTPGHRPGDILDVSYSMPTGLDNGIQRDGKRVALAERVKWWRDDGAGRYTVYFCTMGATDVMMADLVACLARKETYFVPCRGSSMGDGGDEGPEFDNKDDAGKWVLQDCLKSQFPYTWSIDERTRLIYKTRS